MIEQNLLEHLRKISEEERLLLEGEKMSRKVYIPMNRTLW